MLVKIQNPTNECRELTALSAKVDAGTASLPVLNTDGFATNDYIVLRKIGDEQAELVQVNSVAAGTLNLTATTARSHHAGAEIFVIPYNQIEISRKTSASGSFSVLVTIDIQPDTIQTVYDHTQGQTTDFYRVRFYNSTSGQYSSYSNTLEGTGASTSQAGVIIDQVLRRTNDEKADYSFRSEVLKDLNLAYQKVYNQVIKASSEYYQVSLELQTGDFKHEYTMPDNFKQIERITDADDNEIDPVPISDRYDSRGYELIGKNKLYLKDVPEPTSTSTTTPTTVLANNAYDSDGTWTAGDDATNVTTDTDEFKEGTGSINFDIDVSQDADNKATLSLSDMTAQDLDAFEDTGKWRMWVYLPDVTYITSTTFRWGSSSTKYWELDKESDYKLHAFHDGWNLIEFSWGDSAVTETGSPVTADAGAIDYLALIINYSSSQPDDTDFRLDAIRIANTWDSNTVYNVTYLKQPAQVKNEMDEFEIPEGYEYLLIDYAVAQILLRQGDKDTLALRLLDEFDKNLSGFVSQAAKRTRRVIGFRPQYKRRYTIGRSDSTQVTHSDGAVTEL